jgi:hypothetical protein
LTDDELERALVERFRALGLNTDAGAKVIRDDFAKLKENHSGNEQAH